MENVVRTRVFTTDITAWEQVGAVHNEYFGVIRPASTIVEVSGLARPDLLVEVEADAIL
jgi:enamine deaminase RidA (YjgF/YER057c/UK114 family)